MLFSFLAEEVTDVIKFPLCEISGNNHSDLSLSFSSCQCKHCFAFGYLNGIILRSAFTLKALKTSFWINDSCKYWKCPTYIFLRNTQYLPLSTYDELHLPKCFKKCFLLSCRTHPPFILPLLLSRAVQLIDFSFPWQLRKRNNFHYYFCF